MNSKATIVESIGYKSRCRLYWVNHYLFILLFIIRMRIKYSNIHVFPFMEEILKNHLPHYHTKDMLAWHNKKMVYKILG